MGKLVRQPQLLKIFPNSELEFKGDPKEVNISHLNLTNDTNHKIGFKVMTNVPHLLFVSPASDVITPGGQSSIRVMLQPSTDDSPSMRFQKLLIQSIIVRPEDGEESIDKLIARKNNSDDVMETKMNCSFKEVYTSELNLPLNTNFEDNTPVPHPDEEDEQPQKPNLSTMFILMAVLIAIISWYVYTTFVSNDDQESPLPTSAKPKSGDED